ncbi:MAG TPA: HAD family hydrolase [Tepidisphaeraceae bacterium]|nr:HAD family hydrolase [Tepidisphaeraceae bacterium]
MTRPGIFFDRDNTLIVNDGYLGDPEKVVLIDGAAEGIAELRKMGFVIVVFSNQSGVARGLFDESAVHAVNARLDEMLLDHDQGAIIDRHEFCPFHPEGTVEEYRKESPLRKPGPGMIHQAAEKLQLDLAGSWVIGDAGRDIEAGKAAGCRTILFTPAGLAPSPAAAASPTTPADFTVSTLADAVATITAHAPPPAIAAPSSDPPAPRRGEAAGSPPPSPPTPSPATPLSLAKTELLLEQILDEFRRHRDRPPDFAVSKLLAGITQVLALAVLFMAYLYNREFEPYLLAAIFLQCFTIALLIMGRQR